MTGLPYWVGIVGWVAFRLSRHGPGCLNLNIKGCTAFGDDGVMKAVAKLSSQKLSSALCKGLAILGVQHFHFTIPWDPFVFSTRLSTHFIGISMFSMIAVHQNNDQN